MSAAILSLREVFKDFEVDKPYQDLFNQYLQVLPENIQFDDDNWDLVNWLTKKGNAFTFCVDFSKFYNNTLKNLIKCYLLEKRFKSNVSPRIFKLNVQALLFLDKEINTRKIATLNNGDFLRAENAMIKNIPGSAYRAASALEAFSKWLNRVLGLRVSYRNQIKSGYLHGRKATDEQRESKIISSPVLIELLSHLNNENLNKKDKFYISALALLIPTGFRINELMTLPKDCLLKDDDDFGLCYYPSKKPKIGIRHLPTSIKKTIKNSYDYIYKETETGRKIAVGFYNSEGVNWRAVVRDESAFLYFLKKFCHDWTRKEEHYMFNKKGAWLEKENRYIDVLSMIEKSGSISKLSKETGYSRRLLTYLKKAQIASQNNELPPSQKNPSKKRTSWDTDSRVLSVSQFEKYIGIVLKNGLREKTKEIIEQAQEYQLKGEVYPEVIVNTKIEKAFNHKAHSVIKDKKGKAILKAKDALFVIEKYKFSEVRVTKDNDFTVLSSSDFIRWLSGETRSLGTGNTEDSVFSRLNIIDPKTNEVAKFTSHDVRHWLNTYYAEGGLDEESIALYFNRDQKQNATYDQTTSKTRLNNIRNAVEEGKTIGNLQDNYHLLSEVSKKQAKAYLKSHTLMVNLMPHGTCNLNWGVETCEHYNSCFNCENKNGETGVCEYLVVDKNNQEHVKGVQEIVNDSKLALNTIPETSPQYIHIKNIHDNAENLLNDKESKDDTKT
jgi:hypothetical protein